MLKCSTLRAVLASLVADQCGDQCDWCGLRLDACWDRRNGTICPEYHDETETAEQPS